MHKGKEMQFFFSWKWVPYFTRKEYHYNEKIKRKEGGKREVLSLLQKKKKMCQAAEKLIFAELLFKWHFFHLSGKKW